MQDKEFNLETLKILSCGDSFVAIPSRKGVVGEPYEFQVRLKRALNAPSIATYPEFARMIWRSETRYLLFSASGWIYRLEHIEDLDIRSLLVGKPANQEIVRRMGTTNIALRKLRFEAVQAVSVAICQKNMVVCILRNGQLVIIHNVDEKIQNLGVEAKNVICMPDSRLAFISKDGKGVWILGKGPAAEVFRSKARLDLLFNKHDFLFFGTKSRMFYIDYTRQQFPPNSTQGFRCAARFWGATGELQVSLEKREKQKWVTVFTHKTRVSSSAKIFDAVFSFKFREKRGALGICADRFFEALCLRRRKRVQPECQQDWHTCRISIQQNSPLKPSLKFAPPNSAAGVKHSVARNIATTAGGKMNYKGDCKQYDIEVEETWISGR